MVPLRSQLRHEAQAEADVLAGFETDHTGILRDEAAVQRVMQVLDEVDAHSPDHGATAAD